MDRDSGSAHMMWLKVVLGLHMLSLSLSYSWNQLIVVVKVDTYGGYTTVYRDAHTHTHTATYCTHAYHAHTSVESSVEGM